MNKTFARLLAAMWIFIGILSFHDGHYLLCAASVLFLIKNLAFAFEYERVPGGFRVGLVELYVTKSVNKPTKVVEYIHAPCGCRLLSVGSLGGTLMSSECLAQFEADKLTPEEPTKDI